MVTDSTWKRFVRSRFPAVSWAVVMLAVSVLPIGGLSAGEGLGLDKAAHFIEFFILAVLIYTSISYRMGRIPEGSGVLFILITCSCYGIVIELIQHFIPFRDASAGDIAADVLGVCAGTLTGRIRTWRT